MKIYSWNSYSEEGMLLIALFSPIKCAEDFFNTLAHICDRFGANDLRLHNYLLERTEMEKRLKHLKPQAEAKRRENKKKLERFKTKATRRDFGKVFYTVEDLFLITKSGLLIEHTGVKMSYEKGGEEDEDIIASMFVAVQEFIRDSFGGEDEEHTKRMDYGDKSVIIYRGNYVILAAFISGYLFKPFYRKMKDFVDNIEEIFGEELDNWTGIIDAVPDIKVLLESLL